ncbi:MAG TPA: ribosome-associated translation inhibitor RaiA [Actinobacteria bacterium]|jgi:putative sigma-54 modulation protein|nr:ribosome-associated translation inhibitor RaiA [Actinomycetota bacterium]
MEFVIKSRNVNLPDNIKKYAEKKIKNRIEKFVDKTVKTEIEFSLEKNPSINLNNKAEVTIFTPRAVIRAADSGTDFFEAIDKVGSKIERQIKRYKNKMIQKSRKPAETKIGPLQQAEVSEDELKEIVKIKRFEIKPMTPEEASLQMELLGHDFFVFVNADTGKTSVIYKRKDTNYGLIEPQS